MVKACTPTTYGGYPRDKTIYGTATHRSFNILVECSNSKVPAAAELGNNEPLRVANLETFLNARHDIGHVARNVRLGLLYIDLVQPYVESKNSPNVTTNRVTVSWEVLGAMVVDKTWVQVSLVKDFSTLVVETTSQSGGTRWKNDKEASSPIFSQELTLDTSSRRYYIRARAIVDQDWVTQGTGDDAPVPNVGPQTHVVNARTNPDWKYEHNGYVIEGKLEWDTPVLTVDL